MKKENNLALGIAIGVAIGTAIGVATDNLGLWISLGIAIGTAIGTSLMEKNKKSNEKLKWHSGESGSLLSLGDSGLKFKCSFGHTPFLMHPYSDKFIYLADLIPTSNHVHIPWVMGYDIEPGVTTKYKREFLDFVIENNLKVIFEHDPKYWGSHIERNEKGKYICKGPSELIDAPSYSIL